MKKQHYFFFAILFLLLTGISFSCKREKTTAEKLEEEALRLETYLLYENVKLKDTLTYSVEYNKENAKYTLITDEINDDVWAPQTNGFKKNYFAYLKDVNSYIHITDSGTNKKNINVGDWVVVRYKRYNIYEELVESTEYEGNPTENKKPLSYQYISVSSYDDDYFCRAFQYAFAYLGHNGKATVIIPSRYGNREAQNTFTTYIYELEMQVARK